MRPQRAMVGYVIPAQSGPSKPPPLAVIEARAAAGAQIRISELEAMVAAQAAEIAHLRRALELAPAPKTPIARKKTKRKQR